MVSAGHVACTRGSGIVSSVDDVRGMSVVRGVRGVVEYVRCVWLVAAGGGVGDWRRGLGFTNHVGTWGVLDVCLGSGGVDGVDGGMGRGLGPGSEGVVWCYVSVSSDSMCIWQVQVFVYSDRRIYAHLWCTQCSILFSPYRYSLPTMYLFRYRKSSLFVCGCRTLICLDITRFYQGQRQPSSESTCLLMLVQLHLIGSQAITG